MRILRAGCIAAATLVALFIGIELWKNWGGVQDKGFLGVLAVMLIGSLWTAWSIHRELQKNPPEA
jgi:hypothetical protein